MPRIAALVTTLALLAAAPAAAQTPKPPILKIEKAQERVRDFLKTVPNLPEDVVVVPATGTIPWPGEDINRHVIAEVWTVVSQSQGRPQHPLMMFAVRMDTGEVYALYMQPVKDGVGYR